MIYVVLVTILILAFLSALWRWLGLHHLSKEDVVSLQQKVRLNINSAEWSAAEENLKILLDKDSTDLKTLFLQVLLARKMGDYTLSLSIINQVLSKDLNNLLFLKEMGRIYLSQKNAEEALRIFQQCKALIKQEEEVIDLATELFYCKMVEECWQLLSDIMENSLNGRVYALAADCHFQWEQYDKALSLYLKAQGHSWTNHQTLARIGHCYKQQKSWGEAQLYFQKILKQDTSDSSTVLGMGLCLEAQNKYHKALILYQNVEAWKEEDPFILCQAGTCASRLGQYNLSLSYLNKAYHKGFVSPQLLMFLGYSYEHLGEWYRSEEIYLKLVKDYPGHSSGYLALAWLYGVGLTRKISSEQGLNMAKQAVRFQADERAWEILSACEARAGHFERAHDILEHLASGADNKDTRRRYLQSMRTLRKKVPLDYTFVKPVRVA